MDSADEISLHTSVSALSVVLRQTFSSSLIIKSARYRPAAASLLHLRLQQRSIWTNSSAASSTSSATSFAADSILMDTMTSVVTGPTLFEPLSSLFLSISPILGLSYALCIPLFSLALRLTTSLPLALWQRRRTQRFAENVVPKIKLAQEIAANEVRDQSRRAGKSYQEYQEAFKKRVSDPSLIRWLDSIED